MAAIADKSRYFLESSIPELQEIQRKKIFTPQEITAIARQRSDHEHKINGYSSTPSDYLRYATFEMNVETLRKKRVKRLGVKASPRVGQKRVFFVFDRGVRKFPGCLELWREAIRFSRQEKAFKKCQGLITGCVRLHPRKVEIWIYAAGFAVEELGDMSEARGYLQRGLRFCGASKDMWKAEFALELSWVVKVALRRRILGLGSTEQENVVDDAKDNDIVEVDDIMPVDANDDAQEVNAEAVERLGGTPATKGAICIAVFNAAMEKFDNDIDLAFTIFEETQPYIDEIEAVRNIARQISALMSETTSNSWQYCAMQIALEGADIARDSADFVGVVRRKLALIDQSVMGYRGGERESLTLWLKGYLDKLSDQDMDEALKQVITSKSKSL